MRNTWLIALFHELLLTFSRFPVYIPFLLEPAQDVYRFQAQLLKLLVLIGFFYKVTLIVILAPNANIDR